MCVDNLVMEKPEENKNHSQKRQEACVNSLLKTYALHSVLSNIFLFNF